MPVSDGLSHLAMSVPAGTLTEAFRAEVVAFYGRHFGWRDVESLRRPDRMTLSVGGRTYVNAVGQPLSDPVLLAGGAAAGAVYNGVLAIATYPIARSMRNVNEKQASFGL